MHNPRTPQPPIAEPCMCCVCGQTLSKWDTFALYGDVYCDFCFNVHLDMLDESEDQP